MADKKKCPACEGRGMDSWSEPFDQSTAAVCPDCLGDGEVPDGTLSEADYENRFRDPKFLAVWERWQKARAAWREASGHVACHLFQPPHESWNPDLALMPKHAYEAAKEFLEARVAYHAKLAEYPKTDPV